MPTLNLNPKTGLGNYPGYHLYWGLSGRVPDGIVSIGDTAFCVMAVQGAVVLIPMMLMGHSVYLAQRMGTWR